MKLCEAFIYPPIDHQIITKRPKEVEIEKSIRLRVRAQENE